MYFKSKTLKKPLLVEDDDIKSTTSANSMDYFEGG